MTKIIKSPEALVSCKGEGRTLRFAVCRRCCDGFKRVTSIDVVANLGNQAQDAFNRLMVENVDILIDDATTPGRPGQFDAILMFCEDIRNLAVI